MDPVRMTERTGMLQLPEMPGVAVNGGSIEETMTKHILFLFFLAFFAAGCVAFTPNDPASVDASIERGKRDRAKENSAAPADGKGTNEKKDPK